MVRLLFIVILLVLKVLDDLAILDIADARLVVLKLAVGLVALLAAISFRSARKLVSLVRTRSSVTQDAAAAAPDGYRRGKIETKTMARACRDRPPK
jgi:hypothetical protein